MIVGLNRVSYIDYPGEISTIIFTGGCNFRCGWCHNSGLLKPSEKLEQQEVFLNLLDNQKNINHVVISGGEPTIHNKALIEFIRLLKKHNFFVKLDTNGSNPAVVKKLLSEGLLDFIAMDIKNVFSNYHNTIGIEIDLEKIKDTIKLIENSGVDYQFRTTVNGKQHTQDKVDEIRSYLRDGDKLKIQNYKYSSQQLKNVDYTKIEIK